MAAFLTARLGDRHVTGRATVHGVVFQIDHGGELEGASSSSACPA